MLPALDRAGRLLFAGLNRLLDATAWTTKRVLHWTGRHDWRPRRVGRPLPGEQRTCRLCTAHQVWINYLSYWRKL